MTSAKYGEVAHILSQLPLGVSTQPDTEIPQLFPYCGEPHTWGNIECAVSGTAGEENEWLKELQALAAPIWAAALPLSGGLALYHSFQPHSIGQWNSHEKLSLLPSILPLLQPPWVRWCGGNAAGRLQERTTRAVWRLALGSMCYPIGKPAGAALPGTAVTWGKEAPEQPLCSCSAQREHVLSVNCISCWKDP